jgi:hypothetical protein
MLENIISKDVPREIKVCGLSTEGIPEEINVHHKIFGKDSVEVDYDNIGLCPFCNCRIDEFSFCACGGNLGIS